MLSSGANVIIWDKMLSSGMKCYHLGRNVVIWDENVIIWDEMLSSGANVIIWDKMLSSRMKFYHRELMSSSGMKCYHLGCNVIIWN
jgi:hypothetical protein